MVDEASHEGGGCGFEKLSKFLVGSLTKMIFLLFILGFLSAGPKTSMLVGNLSAHQR
jgi:hypothetical protein